MQFISTELPGVILIQPKIFTDERGFFLESYREDRFSGAGIQANFVQDNHSVSAKGVLRGLHYQIRQPQGKLMRVVVGEVFDVAVDLRRGSRTFGNWVGAILSAGNKNELWVPPGFAHGFYVTSEKAEILYKATDYYAPQWERCLLWNDPAIGIDWPLINGGLPILSDKDVKGLSLSAAETYD
ncbi:MAG: dTDP-4-dehydrorhamnose 3,5-epimerase [Chloroflexi bacterium]|nr:dTDP-4-dehydrorhamnose 3,5-epimerase [Chloroflexota bacterium]